MADPIPAANSPEAEGQAKGNKMDSPRESAQKIEKSLESFYFHKARDEQRCFPNKGGTAFTPITLDFNRDANSLQKGLQSLQQNLAAANQGNLDIPKKLEDHMQAQFANWGRGVVDDSSWKQGLDIAKKEIETIDKSSMKDEEKAALDKAVNDLKALETKLYQEALVSTARALDIVVGGRRQKAERDYFANFKITRLDGEMQSLDLRTAQDKKNEEADKSRPTVSSSILRLYEKGIYSNGKHSAHADENGFTIPDNKDYRVGSRNWIEAYDMIFKMHIDKHGVDTPVCLNFSNEQIDDGAFGRNHYKAILNLIEIAEKNGKWIDLDNSQNLKKIIHNIPGYHGLTKFSKDSMRRSDYLLMRLNSLKANVLSKETRLHQQAAQDVQDLRQGHDALQTLQTKADKLKAKLEGIKDPEELKKAKDELDALVKTSATMDKSAPGAKEACVALKEAVAKLRERAVDLGADPKNAAVTDAILKNCDDMDKVLDAKLVEVNAAATKKDLNVTIEPSAPPEAAIGEGAAREIKLSGKEAPSLSDKPEVVIAEDEGSSIEMASVSKPDLSHVSQADIKKTIDALKEQCKSEHSLEIKFEDPVDVERAIVVVVAAYQSHFQDKSEGEIVKDYIQKEIIDKADPSLFVGKDNNDNDFKLNVEFAGFKVPSAPQVQEESSISPSRPSGP